jgi:hypothetical protein
VTTFSNNPKKATFKTHHTHEVVRTIADSKQLALDHSNANRYRHRAQVTIIGTADLRIYDPIYLDGLPNGMSGYWTVLSIKHIFGGRPGNYMMDLEVGTDVIGATSPTAGNNPVIRDVQAEIANQSLTVPGSVLLDQSPNINASSLTPSYGAVPSTPQVVPAASTAPDPYAGVYSGSAPNFSQVKQPVKWVANSKGTVIL